MSNPTELVQRLREHDDERLYQEADVLMSGAANEIERLQVCAATLQKIATVNAMDYEYQNWARQALATLSPLCGAQHAESGKVPAGQRDIALDLIHYESEDGHTLVRLDKVKDLIAAQQAAAPGALDERAEFETWLGRPMMNPEKPSHYNGGSVRTAWEAWQERARRPQAPSAPGTPEAPKGGA